MSSLYTIPPGPYKELPVSRDADYAGWIRQRALTIGASESASLFRPSWVYAGLSPSTIKKKLTRRDLIAIKSGTKKRPEKNKGMVRGIEKEEDALAYINADLGGEPPMYRMCQVTYVSTQWPFMSATPDAVSVTGEIADVKTWFDGRRSSWSQGVPKQYFVQAQHIMAVFGIDLVRFLVVFCDKNDSFTGAAYRVVERDEGFIQILVDHCDKAMDEITANKQGDEENDDRDINSSDGLQEALPATGGSAE